MLWMRITCQPAQCGGEKAAFDAAGPYLKAMGKKVWHCGEAGSGQAAKVSCIVVQCTHCALLYALCQRCACGMPQACMSVQVCNNLALAIQMASIAEASALGMRLGLSATTLADIFNSSSARCWSSDSYHPVPVSDCSGVQIKVIMCFAVLHPTSTC